MDKSGTGKTYRILLVFFLATCCFKTLGAPLPKGITAKQVKQKGVTMSATYDPVRSTWRAEKIKVSGQTPAPSFMPVLKSGLYLFDGGKPASAPTNYSKVKNLKVADGKLSFTSKKDSSVSWHNPVPLPGLKLSHFLSAQCLIKIRQSLPSSKWNILSAVRVWGGLGKRGKTQVLKGTGWQILEFTSRVYPSTLGSSLALGLQTSTPGNNIEIEWIKVGVNSIPSYFRKSIELDSKPCEAELCFAKNELLSLFINGIKVREVDEKTSKTPRLHLLRLKNLAKYFHKGKNVLSVEIDSLGNNKISSFFMEGMIRGENGRTTVIKTSETWKGSYKAPSAWTKIAFDDSSWKKCICKGVPKGNFGLNRGELFLNPPYYGPIDIKNPNLDYFIYNTEKMVELDLTVFQNNFKSNYDLNWELKDAKTGELVKNGVLLRNHDPKRIFKNKLEISLIKPGVYDFFVKIMINGKVVDTRIEEIAFIGKIKQREVLGASYEDGLDLELEDEVDLTDPKSPYEIFSLDVTGNPIESPVVDTPLGRYRISGKDGVGSRHSISYGAGSMFAVAVEHKRIYEPYLVEVDIPDDEPRAMSVRAMQMSRKNGVIHSDGSGLRGWPLGAPGVYTGIDQVLSGKWKKLRFVIFPKNYITGFVFTNHRKGLKAAASKIKIYRIKNGLPALKIASPSHRITGIHSEDLSLFATTFSGEDGWRFYADSKNFPHRGFLKQWYETFENMIKYMRFCGENLSIAGIYMYNPDNRYIWHTRKEANVIELMGRMFEANDMKVMVGVEYARNRSPIFSHEVSDEQMAKGEHSKKVVSKDGKQLHASCGDMDNIYESSVQEGLYELIDGICETYAKTPGIVGIGLQEGKYWLPGAIGAWRGDERILEFGYEDPSISAFEKSSGIKIPVSRKNPKRFSKRYEWIMANCKKEWIQWRNDSTYEINRKIGEIATNANPDWKTYIFSYVGRVNEYIDGSCNPSQLVKNWSFDPKPYKDNKDLVYGNHYQRLILYHARGPVFYLEMRQWCNDLEVLAMSDNGVVHLRDGFFEARQLSKGNWYNDFMIAGDYVCPIGRGYLKAFATIMSHATPLVMAQTWADVNMMTGHEQERREMNRVFQVIPPGQYQNSQGENFNKNIAVRTCDNDSGTAFYVVNPSSWPVYANLAISNPEHAKVRDLAIGTELPVKKGKITFQLKPFETRVFQLSGSGNWLTGIFSKNKCELIGSHAKIADSQQTNAAKSAAGKYELYKSCLLMTDKALESSLKGLHLVIPAKEMRQMAETIVAADEKDDYLTVLKLTEPYPMMVWNDFLQKWLQQGSKSKPMSGVRVNCGSKKSCKDRDGNIWLADQLWLNGVNSWGMLNTGGAATKKGLQNSKGVKCPEIFKAECYAIKGYRFLLENGKYELKLYFSENWVKEPGKRLFNVLIQGKKVVENLDVFKKTGGNDIPLELSFPVTVKDGFLAIDFEKIKNSPMINGIEIVKKNL